ncbi:MAG: hypothetical protein IAF94_19455, partial [Pirellulaceae bacterium]|nr:hypothetical protein [Pirellulaceae bacterium]
MNLQIGLRENRNAFAPGDEIAGAVLWESNEAPREAELRLLWFTRGKGTDDMDVVDKIRFDAEQAGDSRTFSLRAPEAPYSFAGKLISIIWALELVLKPGGHCERIEITIGPEAREVVLRSAV